MSKAKNRRMKNEREFSNTTNAMGKLGAFVLAQVAVFIVVAAGTYYVCPQGVTDVSVCTAVSKAGIDMLFARLAATGIVTVCAFPVGRFLKIPGFRVSEIVVTVDTNLE